LLTRFARTPAGWTQYGTVLVHDAALQIYLAAALLFLALTQILVMLVIPEGDMVETAGALESAPAIVELEPSTDSSRSPGGS